jgi:hypothetical protein
MLCAAHLEIGLFSYPGQIDFHISAEFVCRIVLLPKVKSRTCEVEADIDIEGRKYPARAWRLDLA